MNLIDLRRFKFETEKIISFNDSEIIFGNTEREEDIYIYGRLGTRISF
ncbi:hypothetical protein [Clostridium sp. DJ247]|nr:hypothetical protein [Clostridium sp. DJ247]MBC2581683.1 hypothetical protein [Clostridium sp. DJ247]